MPVSFLGMSAPRAALAGVFRVNPDHVHATDFSLVADKLFKLIEGPAVQIRALFLSESSPVADTAQVFNRNRRIPGVCGEFDEASANDMIHVSLKASSSARQPFQGAPHGAAPRLCLFPLERSAHPEVAGADVVDMSATKEALPFAIGDGRQHLDAPVYAHHGIVGFAHGNNLTLKGDRQVDLVLTDEKPGVPKLPVRKVVGELGFAVEGERLLSSFERPYAQALAGEAKVPASLATLQSDRALPKDDRLLEGPLGGACCSVLTGDVADSVLGDLGRQPEAGAHLTIGEVVQPHGIGDAALLERHPADEITGARPCLHRSVGCARVQVELDSGCPRDFRHADILSNLSVNTSRRAAIPPPAEAGGPLAV